jgi:regulatory protein
MPLITDITQQRRNKKRFSIFIDNSFFAGASDYVIAKYRLVVNTEIDLEVLKEACIDDSVESAKKYVIDYCLHKSKKLITEKLESKEYEEEVIKRVFDFLNKYNLINDSEYAKNYTHDALYLKKNGIQKIKSALKQKGISKEDIEKAVSKITYEEECKMANKALRSVLEKYKRKAKDERDFKQKISSYLYSRGYTQEIISELVTNLHYENNDNPSIDKEFVEKMTYEEEYEIVKEDINFVLEKSKRKAKNERDFKQKISTYLRSKLYSHEIIADLVKDLVYEDTNDKEETTDTNQVVYKMTYEEEYEIVKEDINSIFDKYKRKAKNERDFKQKVNSYLYGKKYSQEIVSDLVNNMSFSIK